MWIFWRVWKNFEGVSLDKAPYMRVLLQKHDWRCRFDSFDLLNLSGHPVVTPILIKVVITNRNQCCQKMPMPTDTTGLPIHSISANDFKNKFKASDISITLRIAIITFSFIAIFRTLINYPCVLFFRCSFTIILLF